MHLLPRSPGGDHTHNNHRLLTAPSPVQTQATAQPPGGGSYPAATPTTWGPRMTGHPSQQGPRPRGTYGPVEGKGQPAELRGADCGVVSLNIIRPTGSERDFEGQHSINLSMAQGGPDISLPSTRSYTITTISKSQHLQLL